MAKATWNEALLAESDETEIVERNVYFPRASIDAHYFEESDHRTTCPWKGVAHYYHVVVDGKRNENAAWYYPNPKPRASQITDHIAFWKGVIVES